MNERQHLAKAFLLGTDWAETEPVFLAGDASARRYYRLEGSPNAVLMDAPPDAGQDTAPFVNVASLLRDAGFSAPDIYACDPNAGFMLLEDLGDAVFAVVMDADPSQELPLYRAALDVLIALDQMPVQHDLPTFDAGKLAQMIAPAFDWYRWALCGDEGSATELMTSLEAALNDVKGEALSLRDFHAENLIWLPNRNGIENVGLLDFQDAMIGPRGYDLVSLLLDARRDVDLTVIETVQAEFASKLGLEPADVQYNFAVLGLQRNLRILGIFVRLALKFNKPRYLDFLPRVWRYVEECAAHPRLTKLAKCIQGQLPAPTDECLKELHRKCGTTPHR